MGEDVNWWESSRKRGPAFHFAFGREASTASGLWGDRFKAQSILIHARSLRPAKMNGRGLERGQAGVLAFQADRNRPCSAFRLAPNTAGKGDVFLLPDVIREYIVRRPSAVSLLEVARPD